MQSAYCEAVIFGSSSNIQLIPVNIGDCNMTSIRSVRNLGAYFDSLMSMEEFVIKKCRSGQFQIPKINRIRKYLSKDSCICLIQGLVVLKLDYANCLLF